MELSLLEDTKKVTAHFVYTMSQVQIRACTKIWIWWMHKVIKYDMMFRKLRR